MWFLDVFTKRDWIFSATFCQMFQKIWMSNLPCLSPAINIWNGDGRTWCLTLKVRYPYGLALMNDFTIWCKREMISLSCEVDMNHVDWVKYHYDLRKITNGTRSGWANWYHQQLRRIDRHGNWVCFPWLNKFSTIQCHSMGMCHRLQSPQRFWKIAAIGDEKRIFLGQNRPTNMTIYITQSWKSRSN
jgi:hypothetical protein